ncbi:probable prolyl 4-hydroxylase 3 isoform X2 [Salvia splendens]|uniref:probable prolyl 4-hydroxylase 3 isoform X2 n=1 Tax=Salvia splendens TaxID=180675 RepID=UPI001C25EA46|nr:probable prolyl 4-hydroxylase 3 isoform X2 [Salvia splendens]
MGKWRGNRHLGMRYSTIVLALSMLLMATVLLLMVLELGIPVPAGPEEESSPIRLKRMILDSSNGGEGLGERGEQRTEVVSWEPRAFIYHNFLSKEECEYLINRATPHMVKSTVVDSETGKSVDSRFVFKAIIPSCVSHLCFITTVLSILLLTLRCKGKTTSFLSVRTSYGTFFKRGQDKVIRAIEKRIADYTLIPVEHGEGLHVLHYKVGQKYNPHFDYFVDEFNTRNGGQRIATLLMYLSDVEEGGETVFPAAKGNISSVAGWNGMSECAKKGVSVKPKMGDALLFWSMHPDATLDPSSLHGSCPVIKGDKWSCTKWMHAGEYKI